MGIIFSVKTSKDFRWLFRNEFYTCDKLSCLP